MFVEQPLASPVSSKQQQSVVCCMGSTLAVPGSTFSLRLSACKANSYTWLENLAWSSQILPALCVQTLFWGVNISKPVKFYSERAHKKVRNHSRVFSPTRPSGPCWSSSHHVRMSFCLSVCVCVWFWPLCAVFFRGLSLPLRSHDQFQACHWSSLSPPPCLSTF